MNRYAIILTHNRPELLAECVAAIAPQVDRILIIDNASNPPATIAGLPLGGTDCGLLAIGTQPPNLAALWNYGFDVVADWHQDGPCWIAMLCDDAIVPPGWFAAVTDAMTQTGAAAGCSNPFGHEHEPRLKTAPDSDLVGRMPGWAFIIDGSRRLRADESMHWWWLDTSMDWEARQAGGMVMIGGYLVPNRLPNDYTNRKPELGEQAGRDAEAFVARWGWRPW